MKQKARQKNNNSVQQMTDAELRRALDYSIGDVVILRTYGERLIGSITDIKLSHNKQFLLYTVLTNSDKGVKFIQARGDQIAFLSHGDE